MCHTAYAHEHYETPMREPLALTIPRTEARPGSVPAGVLDVEVMAQLERHHSQGRAEHRVRKKRKPLTTEQRAHKARWHKAYTQRWRELAKTL